MGLPIQGESVEERVLWMSLWVPGPNGRRGLPFVLVGEPGTVKTSRIGQLSKLGGLRFQSVLASVRNPTDFLGMPMLTRMKLDESNQHLAMDGASDIPVTRYAAPGFAVEASIAKRSVVLLDEVNTCPPAVQAALLRVLFEGVCGEFEMPPGVRMLLAMNAMEDAAGGWEISLPLRNRIGWIPWTGPSVQRWSSYMMNGGGCSVQGRQAPHLEVANPIELEQLADEAHSASWASAVGAVTGFLNARPALAHAKPQEGATGYAWPSLRTWDFAACALAGCRTFGLGEAEQRLVVQAYVGDAACAEFRQWVREADLPDPLDVIDGAVQFSHNPARLDRTAAIMSACTARVCDPNLPSRDIRVGRVWGLLDALPDNALDVAVPLAGAMRKAGLLVGFKPAYKMLARLKPLLEAAGIGD